MEVPLPLLLSLSAPGRGSAALQMVSTVNRRQTLSAAAQDPSTVFLASYVSSTQLIQLKEKHNLHRKPKHTAFLR